MNERPFQGESRLEAYLDGRLEGAERAAFERALTEDPKLAAELRAHQAMAQSMKRLYAPASATVAAQQLMAAAAADVGAAPVGEAASRSAQGGGEAAGVLRRLATAELQPWQAVAVTAAILLFSLGGWQLWQTVDPLGSSRSNPYLAFSGESPYEFYLRKVEDDFAPDPGAENLAWKCTPHRLASITSFRAGATISYTPPGEGGPDEPDFEIHGGVYTEVFSPATVALFATVDGEPVVVLIDADYRAGHQMGRYPDSHGDSGLHAHRRAIGSAVLYEVSPFEEPRLLDRFFSSAGHKAGH